MRTFLTLTALCLTVFLMGCQNGQSATSASASPGMVSECGSACDKPCCPAEAKSCCGEGGSCCAVSPGAVGNECSASCDKASDCGSVCPVTGKSVSPGAVGDEPADCSGKTCPVTGQPVNLTAVDDPAPCSSSCSGK